jgi:hypothetical protein
MDGHSIKSFYLCNHPRLGKAKSPIGIEKKKGGQKPTYSNQGGILCYTQGTTSYVLAFARDEQRVSLGDLISGP